MLKQEHPDIRDTLTTGNTTVYRNSTHFSGVRQYLAIEQTLNRDCGKYRHLCTKPEASAKHYRTAHNAAVTALMREMSGATSPDNEAHKVITKSLLTKDEGAIQKLLDVVSSRMVT